jgi:PD-(D/E)XK nuclease superfamily
VARKDWPYGKAIENGELRYLSPSGMTTADPTADGGCLRKFWYQYVKGIRSPASKAQATGIALHEEIENYLKTGNRSLSSLALAGMHLLPEPGPDLGIELDIALPPGAIVEAKRYEQNGEPEAASAILQRGDLSLAPVKAAGIPIVGYIDLVHSRGTNKGASDVEDTQDPPNTIEVIDHKTTSDPKWIKNAQQMSRTVQMTVYGKWAITVAPHTEHVRLSHNYYVTKNSTTRKVTLRVLPEHIEKSWEHVEPLARSCRDAAREIEPDNVPANTNSCDSYGGCPAKSVCNASMRNALVSFVGLGAAEKILGKRKEASGSMGLLDKMKSETTTPTQQPQVLIGLGEPTGIRSPEVQAEIQALAQEEAHMRGRELFRNALAKINAYSHANEDIGLGSPSFGGEAARYYAELTKVTPAEGYAGTGKLGSMNVATVSEANDLLVSLEQYATNGQIKAPSAFALGSEPIPSLLAPDATPDAVVPPYVAPTATEKFITEPEKEAKTRKPRAKKSDTPDTVQVAAQDATISTVVVPVPVQATQAQTQNLEPAPNAEPATMFSLFVDCAVDGDWLELRSLHPILEMICSELTEMTGDADVRCAKEKSPLAYGKWEGALAAVLREKEIPAGNYYLDTRGSRVSEVAASVLRERCRATGGVFVWGRH